MSAAGIVYSVRRASTTARELTDRTKQRKQRNVANPIPLEYATHKDMRVDTQPGAKYGDNINLIAVVPRGRVFETSREQSEYFKPVNGVLAQSA